MRPIVVRHAIAVDVALFTIREEGLCVLLIKRRRLPFQGMWALPGGFVRRDESVDEAALRELQEQTAIGNVYLEQLYTFGELDRDPRGRIITVAYYALVNMAQAGARAHLTNLRWAVVRRLPELAFDHRKIVEYALERLQNKVNYTTVGFQLLPKQFSLTELQRAYEIILGQPMDKRNFRKKMLQLKILRYTGEIRREGRQRPARLYTFTEPRVIKLQEKGIIVPF